MLCESCMKNKANFHYKSNENGHYTEKHLCRDCAKKEGYVTENTFSSFDSVGMLEDFFESGAEGMLGGFFKNMMDTSSVKSVGQGSVCKGCGMRFSDFLNHGKLGCTKCYETFAYQLEPTINRIHGNIRHNGKFPDGRQEKREKENKLNLLREKLNKAIENQEYEDAAKYRDEIRELEKKQANGNNNTEKEGA